MAEELRTESNSEDDWDFLADVNERGEIAVLDEKFTDWSTQHMTRVFCTHNGEKCDAGKID